MRQTFATSWGRPLAVVFLALATLLTGGCDDGFTTSAVPEFSATPSSFRFGKLTIGTDDDSVVQVKNEGEGDLKIAKIRFDGASTSELMLSWSTGNDPTQAEVGISRSGDYLFPSTLTIAPGESIFFTMNYSPTDEVFDDGGRLVFETNTQNGDEFIPITIDGAGAQILVAPRTVDFERVAAGDSVDREVTVSNVGTANLEITKILLNGSQDFLPLVNDKDPRRFEDVLADPDDDGEPGLAPDAQFTITIRYQPLVEGQDNAELLIQSSDPQVPEVAVDLRANGATQCLKVTPQAVEFPGSLVNRTETRTVNLESCGSEALEIRAIFVKEGSDPAFALDATQLDELTLPFVLPAATPGEALPRQALRVLFAPREQRIYNGTLIVETNDPFRPIREINLLGRGAANACPQARAAIDEFNVLPLDTVVLDGGPSIDQDGPNNKPVSYQWVVTSSPSGSLSRPLESFHNPADPANQGPEDDIATPTALFWVDLAGTYTLELRVTDRLGLDSIACDNAAVVTIVAKPEEAIHVQLIWRTPSDPDETDGQGADLDLHLLHPNALSWFSDPFDAYYANPVPDWGQLENPVDDPSLDIDDINGGGPENINLDQPENTDDLGAPYLVGVHYYNSQDRLSGFDYGPTFARVRIFLNGELAWDYTDDEGNALEKEMQAEDHFWDVAQINWPAATVETRDRYYDQRP